MYKSRIVLSLGLIVLTAAVAFAQKVTTDYDKGANFAGTRRSCGSRSRRRPTR